MRTQAEKARAFRALHERPGLFIMPNPWDAGTAKLFASLGFEALATTSLGMASMLGKLDGTLSVKREELIENCRTIAPAARVFDPSGNSQRLFGLNAGALSDTRELGHLALNMSNDLFRRARGNRQALSTQRLLHVRPR